MPSACPRPSPGALPRNTQHVLLEEARLGHVADPAGGAWFVEKLTRDLAERAWSLMQQLEAHDTPLSLINRWTREGHRQSAADFATRRATITGVTDFPLLGAAAPDFEPAPAAGPESGAGLAPIRWAEPFEKLRDKG